MKRPDSPKDRVGALRRSAQTSAPALRTNVEVEGTSELGHT